MATVEGDKKIEPPGLGPRTRRSAATMATGDMAGGGGEGEREGPLGYVLSLPAASLPLPVAVTCLDAAVPRKPRSGPRLRAQPCAWWAFKLPVPLPEEARSPASPASAATNSTGEARAPRPQRLRQVPPPPGPGPDPHTPSPAMERPAKRARRCLQCGAAETPRWRSGPMGPGSLCNACGVRLKAAGALREQVHRPPPATARTVAEPPPAPGSPVSDSSPDGPIWEPGSVPDVYLLRKKPPKQGRIPPPPPPPPPAPEVYLLKKKNNKKKASKTSKPSKKKPWRPRKSAKRCLHCGSSSTPQWREGPMGRSTLCNACGVRYRQGRLLPEYRPIASPTFEPSEHANRHSQVLQLHRQRKSQSPLPTPQPRPRKDDPAGSDGGDDPTNALLARRWHGKNEYPPTPPHQPLPQPADSIASDRHVGDMDDSVQGRGGGNGPNGAPSSLDSLLLEGPSAPLIVDGEESLIN
ncbi:unnamed protein product [Urochloa humidicola]